MTRLGLLLFLITATCLSLAAQQPPSAAFEVVSVKPHTSDDGRMMATMQPGGRFVAINVPLRLVIRTAFNVQNDQIVGAPDWLDDIRPEQIAPMMQALLAHRFSLKTHQDKREVPVFALQRVKRDDSLGAGLRSTVCPELEVDLKQAKPCANVSPGVNILTVRGAPIAAFAQYLAPYVNRVVVDRTGLDGRYDIVLKWASDQQAPKDDLPSLFTALQEQLGLKLESSKAMVDVLVIDSAERPTPD
jgi:uncharacterized protein (TIGR03435 family)